MSGYENDEHFKQLLMVISIGRYIPERERSDCRLVYQRRRDPLIWFPVRGGPPVLNVLTQTGLPTLSGLKNTKWKTVDLSACDAPDRVK